MKIDMQKFRPLPFYFIDSNDMGNELSAERIDQSMAQLKADGFGGCILFNLPPYGFPEERYLTPEWFEMTERFILAAEKYGLVIWFTDGWRCPSGDVGGKIAKIDPSLKAQRLVKNEKGEVEAVDVDWGFPGFEYPKSSELFIELVYESYYKHLGKYFGNTLAGIFSDADNRRFDAFTAAVMSGEYYPWSKNFSAFFRKEFDYDIEPYLPDIVDGKHSPQSYDYQCCCEKLYLQWFANNYEWCKAHHIQYTFHTSDTGPFPRKKCRRSSVFTEGNSLHFYRHSDFPGTDHELLALDGGTHFDSRLVQLRVSRGSRDALVRTPSFADTKYDLRAKYAASAAWLYGKKGAMSELFAAANWGATPGDLRRIAAWQMLQGINMFVPHAIHHLFFGALKYGAPPEQHYGTGGSIRELNDFIAKYAFITSQGKYAPSVLVADATEAVRGGAEDTENFFIFTDQLNHAGISYVIVPENTPGAICALNSVPALPEREFTFSGCDLLAMRRQLEDGSRFLIVCNLWRDTEVSGVLEFENRRVEIELAPGEMAVIGGPFEEFRSPVQYAGRIELAFPVPVKFGAENRIPYHYNSKFTIRETLSGMLKLRVPMEFTKEGVAFDGEVLRNGRTVRVFDDPYLEFDVSGTAGEHRFELAAWKVRPASLGKPQSATGNDSCDGTDYKYDLPVYLAGDFDAVPEVEGEFDHQVYTSYYILQIWDPAKCHLTLSRRRDKLESGSWAEQGQPFYSGTVTYRFDISGFSGCAVLETPDAAVRVEAVVDGKTVGASAMPPFRIPLGDVTTSSILELKVTNTLANQLEEYLAPSGLISGAIINLI